MPPLQIASFVPNVYFGTPITNALQHPPRLRLYRIWTASTSVSKWSRTRWHSSLVSRGSRPFSVRPTGVAGAQSEYRDLNPSVAYRSISIGAATCPGCGATAQAQTPGLAGFYSLDRRAVDSFVSAHADEHVRGQAPEVDACHKLAENLISEEQRQPPDSKSNVDLPGVPICDRCHDILHHSKGVAIVHPPMESIEEYISASPYTRHHVYHVIDAADFPMSMVPTIYKDLSLAEARSKNRRAKHNVFRKGAKAEMSFIITRADLLAPTKSQVDRLMPYLTDVLRNRLGSYGDSVRLGNIRCVSAKRGWWTKEMKSDIWDRGGAGWLVGKANVGKSSLFEHIFPKGSGSAVRGVNRQDLARSLMKPTTDAPSDSVLPLTVNRNTNVTGTEYETCQQAVDTTLPPARLEEAYPKMPLVSSLAGTTASPIRVPFGQGRGELVDLPGLARSDLEQYVLPYERPQLTMTARVVPQQHTVKAGQSLLLGGLVRITPTKADTVILAYSFVPLNSHVTATHKAVDMESGTRKPMLPLVVSVDTLREFRSAGHFSLRWDVTKQRSGPLVAKSAVGLNQSQLPFRVMSTDVVIESLGWVELVCQVRRTQNKESSSSLAVASTEDSLIPEVEIFTPSGRFVQERKPMGAWMLNQRAVVPKSRRTARPRKSMAGTKTRERNRQ